MQQYKRQRSKGLALLLNPVRWRWLHWCVSLSAADTDPSRLVCDSVTGTENRTHPKWHSVVSYSRSFKKIVMLCDMWEDTGWFILSERHPHSCPESWRITDEFKPTIYSASEGSYRSRTSVRKPIKRRLLRLTFSWENQLNPWILSHCCSQQMNIEYKTLIWRQRVWSDMNRKNTSE